tara:strand:- start:2882 stop:3700 length:819 start_codon:yes stop_codon:yes gene_type:complete
MKKNYRILQKYLNFVFIKFISFFLEKINYKIIPSLAKIDKFDYNYSEKTRRLVFNNNKEKFGKIIIDTSLFNSSLCQIGKYYNTNKSPYNLEGHRSGYTGFYFLLFSQLKKQNITIAEIGIEKNASTKLWREYFDNAEIHAFEYEKNKIQKALKDNLRNTSYHEINVEDQDSINQSFAKLNKKFDIIIDDSTHIFEHQINIIYNVKDYIKENGILIIEDIYKNKKDYNEIKYYEKILPIKDSFKNIFFVETSHINNFTASWKNEKLLILIKK